MKYLIEYTFRAAGLSFDQNFAGSDSLLTAFAKWKPEDEKGLSIHAFVSDLVGRDGYILAEASDPKVITTFVSKYNFWNEVKVVPVIDIGELIPIAAGSLDWAKRAAKG
ncbi:MAG: DUF3303 domain-containing protein [Bradyrhizobium sp.]|nr:DUF3303 domain-containing protein [Bradyrhizobium sp.]